MFVLEYKVNPKPHQVVGIDEAIRTVQFVRNKALRYWMDNRGVGKTELFHYNTRLRKEFKFVSDLNSHACQAAIERVLRAINKFFDNCKKQVKGKQQSQNYRKARRRSARKHLRVSRQREEFAKRVALRLIQSNDLVTYEDLNVKGLVKNRHLSKSISDAGWSLFRQ